VAKLRDCQATSSFYSRRRKFIEPHTSRPICILHARGATLVFQYRRLTAGSIRRPHDRTGHGRRRVRRQKDKSLDLRRPGCHPHSYRFRRSRVAENEEATREHRLVLHKLFRSDLFVRDDVHQRRVLRHFRRSRPHF